MIPEQVQTANRMNQIKEFEAFLYEAEKSRNTIEKYVRDVRAFFSYLQKNMLTKETLLGWKESLSGQYAPVSINSMLAAVNHYLKWLGKPELCVKPLKIQREIYRKPEKELSQEEYFRLVKTAERNGNARLSVLLQTLCATGIRVSELQYITAEAVLIQRANVQCKGKNRTVFLPANLCKILKGYMTENQIQRGMVFHTKSGEPLDRTNIWKEMKKLCAEAGIENGKVFPHNLRHLFARTYYKIEKDLSRLADLLGHANVSTTRIYTMESGKEHVRQLERLGLVFSYEKNRCCKKI